MSSERISPLVEMRLGREESSTAFMEFTSKRKYHSDYAFCFYEGEDGKYYNNRIRNIIGDKFIHIKAGNKNNVLKAMKLIKSKIEYKDVTTMFFVDRDMGFDMPEYEEDDVFVTPCYSIENLYVNENSFGKILEDEFSLNVDDEDYKKYKRRFVELYEQFCDIMLEFNALILIRKEKELDCEIVKIQDIETAELVNIDINNGVSKSSKYDINIIPLKEKLDVTNEDIESAKNRLLKFGKQTDTFRGKNQFDFMTKLIEQLCDKKRRKSLFNPVPTSICINPNTNQNRLSTFSMYAQTPDCLKTFLQAHKSKNLVTC